MITTAPTHNEPATLRRIPELLRRLGISRSSAYRMIDDGTLTPPITLGIRSAAWPEHEIDAIVRARIAGASRDDLRELVRELLAERAGMWPRIVGCNAKSVYR